MVDKVQTPARGVFWMVVTGLCFVAVTALVKSLGQRIPAQESAFLRYVLGLVFLLPMAGQFMQVRLTPRLWRLFSLRALFHTGGVVLWFYAMTRIPIAEVTAMNYLNPVYVTVLAVFFLGERLALRRVMAIVAALLGAVMILRPGFRELDPGHFAMLAAALFFAGSYLLAKILSGEVSAAVVVVLLSLGVTIGLAPLAIAVWVWPTWWELLILLGVALFATSGHYTMTLAFAAAPVTVTQPVTFLQLVWAVVLGAVLFAEPVDPWVIAGGSLILAAVVFITWREAVLKRRVTPLVSETKN
ncbi:MULTISPECIES: DMT family transporter [Mameliella]|uniref:DMT family transporter n=1 Tax=Mameliella TaxID=1434019 RepID=UPI0008855C94|nr:MULTISPECIES: DMT family transporter [Mameliella]MCR9273515.1 DMT family transporter [Paracoccaceae bacterium]PTR35849.1 threonine/homoserine efflux transporter RhtA [Mameliella alba]SDE08981.1 Threonine/homoserine efflux transporter RhtA [Mameliella alba]BBU57300.1 peptide ABC transporter permease [Mameliella alba]GGF82184.1 peptide ABC transporter permease [Mameliella alba]